MAGRDGIEVFWFELALRFCFTEGRVAKTRLSIAVAGFKMRVSAGLRLVPMAPEDAEARQRVLQVVHRITPSPIGTDFPALRRSNSQFGQDWPTPVAFFPVM